MVVRKDPIKWDEFKSIVDTYQLDKLGRSAEQERVYRNFKDHLAIKGWDLVTNLLIHSLNWLPEDFDPYTPSSVAIEDIKCIDPRPFANEEDTKIIWNDFPYFYAEPVAHVCVWVKFPMEADPKSSIGDINLEMKRVIERYVVDTFCLGLKISRSDVIWWKNYTAIQSIRALPHVHVAVRLSAREGLQEAVDNLIGTPGQIFDYVSGKF